MDVGSMLVNRNFSSEFVIKATRSSGKGGQNVNKVSSKIELSFNLPLTVLLTDPEKVILAEKWINRLSQEGTLRIICQEDRSQLKNKEIAIRKFYGLLKRSLLKPKKRLPTKPTKAIKEARLKDKKLVADKKQNRKRSIDHE